MNEINFVINLTTWEGTTHPLPQGEGVKTAPIRPLSLRERVRVRGKQK
jgi:hypothetical protein